MGYYDHDDENRYKERKGNKAAIMVTHDERMLEYCDKVYRMEDGRLIHDDSFSHEKLKTISTKG